MIDFKSIEAVDPELCGAMRKELTRQREHLELIASENFVSDAVLAAMGSHLTNKYAEGYPGKRYYGGCQYVDIVEDLARERAKALFGAEHANVQPHSGAQANMAVYFAMLEPGDTVMGHESFTRRTSDARQPGQHVRQILPFCVLRRNGRERSH